MNARTDMKGRGKGNRIANPPAEWKGKNGNFL